MARITATLVTVRTTNGVAHLYAGDVVPSSVTPESLANLKSLGFISEDTEPDAEKRPVKTPVKGK